MSDLHELPDADFRMHTLDLVGVSMGAWGLRDEILRWPSLPHLKALYLNGRLWYGQPATLVADTIALFNGSTALEKFVLSKPVQTYIPDGRHGGQAHHASRACRKCGCIRRVCRAMRSSRLPA